MSKKSGHLYHPINNYPEPIYTGFSWPNLFFGFLWFLYKGMWAWAIICFVVAIGTLGFSNLIIPFFANQLHQKYLLKSGYLGTPKNESY